MSVLPLSFRTWTEFCHTRSKASSRRVGPPATIDADEWPRIDFCHTSPCRPPTIRTLVPKQAHCIAHQIPLRHYTPMIVSICLMSALCALVVRHHTPWNFFVIYSMVLCSCYLALLYQLALFAYPLIWIPLTLSARILSFVFLRC